MIDESSDPFEQALAWLRAHEFADAERIAPGSSVIDGTLLRGRVWTAPPAASDLADLASATPEGSWTVAVLLGDPDAAVDGATTVAVMVLDDEHGMRPVNPLAHDLLEWIGGRQRAKSFAARAMHALAAERPEEAAPEAPKKGRGELPVRGQSPAVVRNATSGPMTVAAPAASAPAAPAAAPPPAAAAAPTADAAAAAVEGAPAGSDLEVQLERIESMRRQRELRKSFKKR